MSRESAKHPTGCLNQNNMTPQQPQPVYITNPAERLIDMLVEEMFKVFLEEMDSENNLP